MNKANQEIVRPFPLPPTPTRGEGMLGPGGYGVNEWPTYKFKYQRLIPTAPITYAPQPPQG
jgi:hypothetical protein